MSLSIPNTFTGGTKARANEVNANFSAVAAKFTEGAGGISDVDIAAGAGIKASKLSSVAGQRVTATQLEDDAVDSRILKDDPGAGSPNAAVSLAAHIKDGIITGAKLVAATIAKDKLKLSSVVVTIAVLNTGIDSNTDTTLNSASAFPIGYHREGVGIPAGAFPSTVLRLNTTDGKYYIYAWNMSGTTATTSFDVRVWYLSLT
jgi:hypothetical protein